jgi:hypothetical protein
MESPRDKKLLETAQNSVDGLLGMISIALLYFANILNTGWAVTFGLAQKWSLRLRTYSNTVPRSRKSM